jgi:type IV secretory pathway VirD2 relaxase
MQFDDEFDPKLGRIRARGGRVRSRYLSEIARSVGRAGGRLRSSRGKFSGSRSGRGAGVGRVLGSRDRHAAFRQRRVVVKTRLIKLAARGLKGARAHLRYLQRDGVTREGLPGDLYNANQDRADGKAFLERCDGDRHQFRFIVAAEDAVEYQDLKEFTRRLMSEVEQDLGSKLDWIAVDHYNTGHPHTHIVLRGKDEHDKDLIIARDYLSHGMRERAAEIATLDLGPRTDHEIATRLRSEVEQERFTSLDRSLLREADENGVVRSGSVAGDSFQQTLRAGRLQKLSRLGLAEEMHAGQWKLAEDLEPVLRKMGERGDIIKAIHQELARESLTRLPSDYVIYDPDNERPSRIVGRVLARGLSDELNDRHYLIVDGVDGKTHYVEIGKGAETEPIPAGAIVAIEPRPTSPRPADRTVAEIAATNEGRYGIDIHLTHDPGASQAFTETHVRRLEAMRRAGFGVERTPDGTWIIGPDHLQQAASFERLQAQTTPVRLETLSSLALERQVAADGATWLDRELVGGSQTAIADAGFGREVRDALARRRQWLIEQDFARQERDRIVYRANLLSLLRRRELTRVGGQISKGVGLSYAEAQPGDRIAGVYRRYLDLASGRFALIEKSREFTLVPWRPVLERNLGKQVSGVMRSESVSWNVGRQRGGPSIGA